MHSERDMLGQLARIVTWCGMAAVLLCGPVALVAAQSDGTGQVMAADGPVSDEVRTQDNVVVVLDASGSMREKIKGTNRTRMDDAKQAILQVLTSVPKQTNVGVLVFSGIGKGPTDWIVPLGRVNVEEVRRALSPISPNGGTPLGEYMRIGADRLLEQRTKQLGYGTFRLLLVTDGEESQPRKVDVFLPDIMSRGIAVNVIGLDMNQRHSLATRVSSYRSARNAGELAGAMQQVFAEISTAGRDQSGDPGEALDGLPTEGAMALLTALKPTGNHPIGTEGPESVPAAKAGPPQQVAQSGAQTGAQPAGQSAAASSAPGGAGGGSAGSGGSGGGTSSSTSWFNCGGCGLPVIIGAIVMLSIFSSIKKGGRR